MAEITQRLGFDATQAISALQALDAALKPVNRKLAAFNASANQTGAQAMASSLSSLSSSAQSANTSLTNTASNFTKTGEAGKRAATDITVSWETMVRVVQTQIIVRALNAGIRAFGDSADAAADFQEKVARIAGIVGGAEGSIENLSASLKDLAVEIGRPIDEVAGAAYEAFQNDLGNVAETMEFLKGATLDLSLVTGANLTDSVNTLSSVLKSYNLDIAEASRVTDLLYQTIDSGRVNIDDLADGIGTIAPLAREAGLSLEDMFAATAAITLGGTNAATAITQLRNVTAKGIRPTQQMQASLEQLGFETFDELIKGSGGFVNALQALIKTVNGNKQATADMFNTIRAQLGVFGLTADGAKVVTRILDEMEESAGRAAKTAAEMNTLDFRKAQEAAVRLERAFLDLGESTLPIRTAFNETLADIIDNVNATEDGILGIGQAAGTAAILVQGASLLIGGSLLGLIPTFALVGAAIAAHLGTKAIVEGWKDLYVESERLKNQRIADEKAITDTAIGYNEAVDAQVKSSLEERAAAVNGWKTRVEASYNSILNAANKTLNEIALKEQQALDAFTESRKQAVEQIKQFIDDIDKRIEDTTSRIQSGMRSLEDFNFDRSIKNLSEQQKSARLLEEAEKAAGAARRAAATAGTDERARANARELQEIAEQKAQRALSAADSLKNTGAIFRAEERVRDTLKQGIQSEKALRQDLQSFREGELRTQQQQVEDIFKKQEAGFKNLLELQKQLADPSRVVTAVDLQNLEDAKTRLNDLLDDTDGISIIDLAKVRPDIDEATNYMVEAVNRAQFEFTNLRANVQAQLASSPFQAVLDLQVKTTGSEALDSLLSGAADGSATPVEALIKQEQALIKNQGEQRKLNELVRTQNELVALNLRNLEQDIDSQPLLQYAQHLRFLGESADAEKVKQFSSALVSVKEQVASATSETLPAIKQTLIEATTVMKGVIDSGVLGERASQAATQQLLSARKALDARAEALKAETQLISPEETEASKNRIREIQSELKTLPQADSGLDKLKNDASQASQSVGSISTNATQANTSLTNASSSTSSLAQSAFSASGSITSISTAMPGVETGANNAATAMNSLKTAAEAAARAIASVNSAQAGGTTANAYFGSKVNYRAAGGFSPRGGDTQLTATQPGEYIVSSRASNNFLAELQAMNAGQRPQFREDGGQVTNVGDINVSIHTDSARDISGKDIATNLRRELRRGTSRI